MSPRRTCPNGHVYDKTSDCPVCPICEKERKPAGSFLALLSAPARRALENAGITSEEQLARHSEREIMELHGMGQSSLPKLKAALAKKRLQFKRS